MCRRYDGLEDTPFLANNFNFEDVNLCCKNMEENPVKVLVTKRSLNEMTEFCGAENEPILDGSSSLVQLEDKHIRW